MSSAKIHTIILGLILIQCVWATPLNDTDNSVESSEEKTPKNLTTSGKLLFNSYYNLLLLGKNTAAKAVNVSRYILKDQDMVANTNPEVVEFKRILTTIVEKYESSNRSLFIDQIIDTYSDTTDHYLELDQEKVTPESAFIIGILNKYNAKDVVNVKFDTEFLAFMDSFEKIMEEFQAYTKNRLLNGYKIYSATDISDLFTSVIELV